MRLPVMPPVAPMLARPASAIPPGEFYEPKWDGFRAIVFRDGAEVEIGSRKERPMTRYFPDVVAAVRRSFPARAVIDGEIVIVGDGGGLDFWALQQRIHPAATRVSLLAEKTPASFVAFDLLALDDVDLTLAPFAQRRAALERALGQAAPPVHVTPITRDVEVARDWFARFEGAGLDGLIAKRADQTYQPDKRVMTKIKHVRTADCVVAGYRVHKSAADAIGSLLLGLYVDDAAPPSHWLDRTGGLAPVGVIGAFPMARRRELFAALQASVVDVAEHPWSWAAELAGGPEGGSRWNPKRDLSFVPLRPERVVEVRYDYLEGARFRHPPQFVRWRPDRDPGSCGFAQLEQPARFDVADVLAGYVSSGRRHR
jgi:ATP-dependent DNA ligase